MKSCVAFVLFTFPFVFCFAQKIELQGTYQGKNIYIQNPSDGTTNGFCTQTVYVNGIKTIFENGATYIIPLDSFHLKRGDSIKIEIFHKPDCKPKILADNAHSKGTFQLASISIDSADILHWTSIEETEKLPYAIEQFNWNKWIKVGEVAGKGGINENNYSFQTVPHSGKNEFRIRQTDANGKTNCSRTVILTAPDLEVKVLTNQYKIADELEFNKATRYEVYDSDGNMIRKGYEKKIDFKGLKKGGYYLNYDNKMTQATKFW